MKPAWTLIGEESCVKYVFDSDDIDPNHQIAQLLLIRLGKQKVEE